MIQLMIYITTIFQMIHIKIMDLYSNVLYKLQRLKFISIPSSFPKVSLWTIYYKLHPLQPSTSKIDSIEDNFLTDMMLKALKQLSSIEANEKIKGIKQYTRGCNRNFDENSGSQL